LWTAIKLGAGSIEMLLLTLGLLSAASAFSPAGPLSSFAGAPAARAAVCMGDVELRVAGDGLSISEAMRQHAEAKLGVPIRKFDSVINAASPVEVLMKVEQRSVHDNLHVGKESHAAECTLRMNGGQVIRVAAESSDMYSTIDDLEARLATKLRKFKERRSDVKIARKAKGKDELNAEPE